MEYNQFIIFYSNLRFSQKLIKFLISSFQIYAYLKISLTCTFTCVDLFLTVFFFSFVSFSKDYAMNLILITVTVVICCATLTKAFNTTNSTNSSLQTNSTNNNTTPLTTLYIGAFFDLTDKNGYGALPMALQAIEEINNNPSVLPGYQLELVVKSTQVKRKNI